MPCGRIGGACAPFAPPWVRHCYLIYVKVGERSFLHDLRASLVYVKVGEKNLLCLSSQHNIYLAIKWACPFPRMNPCI